MPRDMLISFKLFKLTLPSVACSHGLLPSLSIGLQNPCLLQNGAQQVQSQDVKQLPHPFPTSTLSSCVQCLPFQTPELQRAPKMGEGAKNKSLFIN